jgi:hypothetical protein
MGENHGTFFNVSEDYIHQKHQLPKFSSTNWKEAPTPWFTGSNLKEATTP